MMNRKLSPTISAARGQKVKLLQEAFAKYDRFETVDVPDISSGDFSAFLKGTCAFYVVLYLNNY